MVTIVFIDHDGDEFNPNSLGVLAKAASLGGEVTAFVAGSGIDDGWAAGLGAHGAARVLVADDAALTGLPQPMVDALEPHAREASAVLFGAGVASADVAAGLAARLGAGINCETTEFTLGEGAVTAVAAGAGRQRDGGVGVHGVVCGDPVPCRTRSHPRARGRARPRSSGCR